jgi:hypothetical protein
MNAQQTETNVITVEWSINLTAAEIGYVRVALTQAAMEPDWREASVLLVQSLRQRRSKYQVRQLGAIDPRGHSIGQFNKKLNSRSYNAGV